MVTKKIPVKELSEKQNIIGIVEKTLKEDLNNAYTVEGLMIEKFGVAEKDIQNKTFGERKREHNTLYGRVTSALRKLLFEGKIKVAKHGKAKAYWWAGKA